MANEIIKQTFPVGRMIMGSVSQPQTKDADGKPLVVKSGPDMGKPTQKFFLAVAYPKTPGVTHWSQEAWGAEIWKLGHQSAPGIAQSPTFSWKIDDGDSQIPNKKGKRMSDNPNARGHWVVFFSQPSAIACYNYRASQGTPIDPKGINAGDFVQVAALIRYNNSTQNPGVYMNPQMVDLVGYGERIVQGADPTTAGFGTAALPAGASTMPTGAMPVGAAPVAPPAYAPPPPVPGAAPVPPVPAAAAPALPPAFNPNPAILAGVPPVPGVVAAPPAPPPAPPAPPAAPAGPVMTAKAAGASYESFIAAGWTIDALKANGYVA